MAHIISVSMVVDTLYAQEASSRNSVCSIVEGSIPKKMREVNLSPNDRVVTGINPRWRPTQARYSPMLPAGLDV
jgi:hypothetical protein